MTSGTTSPAGAEFAQLFATGQRLLNRFKLDRVLGQGGMGVVWLAWDEELERDVALKFLPSIIVNDRASLNDLKRETKRSLELTHPHIVRTYDFVQDQSVAGISMEYVDSSTLRNRCAEQPTGNFEPAALGEWVRQLCDALDYAHQHAAIVHRDLKPANLMVNGRGELKIADFGISRSLVESVTQVSGVQCASGTLVYMSPQQLAGDQTHPLDDIYAAGATLYELCTSRPPFYTGDITSQICGKVAPSMAERRRQLGIAGLEMPRNWETTVAACLTKDPGQRPQSAGELAVRLGLKEAASLASTRSPLPTTTSGSVNRSGPNTGFGGAPPNPVFAKTRSPIAWRLPSLAVTSGLVALLGLASVLTWYLKHPRQGSSVPERSAIPLTQVINPPKPEPASPPPAPVPSAEVRGSLIVKSEPSQATVTLDGRARGETPVVVDELAPGPHDLALNLPGYEEFRAKIEVHDQTPVKLDKIALEPSVGGLEVTTDPPSAIEILAPDHSVLRYHGSAKLPKLKVGDYTVTARRADWSRGMLRQVHIARGETRSEAFSLKGGTLTMRAGGVKARVLLDAKEIGMTDMPIADIEPGTHQYAIRQAGYTEASGSLVIEAGQPVAQEVKLSKLVAEHSAPVRSHSAPERSYHSAPASDQPTKGQQWMRILAPGGIIH